MIVNPYDVDAVADAMLQALRMPREERVARMRPLRKRVIDYDVHTWAGAFMARLHPQFAHDGGVQA